MGYTQSQKKIIGFDLDGVIIDHTESKIRIADQHGWKINPAETPTAILQTVVPKTVMDAIRQAIYYDAETSLSPSLMADMVQTLTEIKKRKLPYVLISRRRMPEFAINLLKLRGLWPDFFNDNNAFFVADADAKNQKASETGITHYLDDEPQVLEKLTCVKHRFLLDPHGAFPDADFYTRVNSWQEFLKNL